MGCFTSNLVVTPCSDGKMWVLTDRFEFHYREAGQIRRLVVPHGFLTDFASVPLPFRLIFPPWGKYGQASVIHDWMYWDQSMPRVTADRVFLDGMRTLRVLSPVRWIIYAGVRLFGRSAWMWNREERARGTLRVLAALPNDQPATASFRRQPARAAAQDAWPSGAVASGHSRYL